jgi:hypothetical protein
MDINIPFTGQDWSAWWAGAAQPPPEEWLPLLKRIRDSGKLCQLFVTPQGALTITRELGRCSFTFCIQEPMAADEAKCFLRELTRAQTN